MNFDKRKLLLYAVTDRSWTGEKTLAGQVEESLRGGVTMVQLREKDLDRESFRAEGLELKKVCRRYGVPLLINDDVDLAWQINAAGVHVGQEDMETARAREILGPDKIVGVSVHTVEEALAAQEAGADYLGLGAAFPTSTKEDADVMPREVMRAICERVDIPCVAIGGIGPDTVPELAGCALAGIAVVSAIYAQKDIRAAAENLRRLAGKLVGVCG